MALSNTSLGVEEEADIELYRTIARSARINSSYSVHPPMLRSGDVGTMTTSFSEAFALLKADPTCSLAVLFDWSVGGSSGMDVIHCPAEIAEGQRTEHYASRLLSNLIIQRISISLMELERAAQDEYFGPVDVVAEAEDILEF